jgi:hypothetical protein
MLALGGGLATAVTAAAVAIVVLTGPGSSPQRSSAGTARSPALPEPAVSTVPALPGARQAAPAPPLDRLRAGNGTAIRRVERSAEITLAARGNRIQQVADDVAAVTGRHHGFVQHENVSTGTPAAGGSIELRVPVGELDSVLRDLSGVARVVGRTETADDVTREYTAVTAKVARTRSRRADLVRRIAHASSTAEADQLRAELSSVDLRIRRLTSSLRTLNQETNFADVQVTLQVDRRAAATGSSTSRALHDALGILVGAVDFGIRAMAVLIPLGLVAAALIPVLRTLRRRRREAVLA